MRTNINRKGKLLALLVICVLYSLSIFSSLALTETGQEGEWDLCVYPYFLDNSTSVNTGSVSHTNGTAGLLTNGTGVNVDFTINALSGNRVEWFWLSGTKRVVVVLELKNGNETVWAWFYVAHEDGIAVDTRQALFGANARLATAHPILENGNYSLRIFNLNETAVSVVTVQDDGWGYAIWNFGMSETVTVSPSFWNNPTVSLYLWHEGVGNFELTFGALSGGGMDYTYSTPLDVSPTWVQDLNQTFEGLVNIVRQGTSLAIQVLGALGSAITAIAPYLPLISLTYFIDLAFASMREGSFRPIGYAYSWFIGLWSQAYTWIIETGKLIWDVITFWS